GPRRFCDLGPDDLRWRGGVLGDWFVGRLPCPENGDRQRPYEPRDAAHVASVRRFLLIQAVPRGDPAFYPGVAADATERCVAGGNARRQIVAGDRLAARNSGIVRAGDIYACAEMVPLAVEIRVVGG